MIKITHSVPQIELLHVDRVDDIIALFESPQMVDEPLDLSTFRDIEHILRCTFHLLPIEYQLSQCLSCTPSNPLHKQSDILFFLILRVLIPNVINHRVGTICIGFPICHPMSDCFNLFIPKSTFNESGKSKFLSSDLFSASFGLIVIARFVSGPRNRFVNVIESLIIDIEIPSLFRFRGIRCLKIFIFRHRRRGCKQFGDDRHHDFRIQSDS